MPSATSSVTVHIFGIYHSTNMTTTLQIQVKSQHSKWAYRPNISACMLKYNQLKYKRHVIAKYMLKTNMPTTLGIYAKYDNYFWACIENVHSNLPNMKSMQSTMWQAVLCTFDRSLNKYGCQIANMLNCMNATCRTHISSHNSNIYLHIQTVAKVWI